MTRTVFFNCPMKAEIRAVYSQSDLRICYLLVLVLVFVFVFVLVLVLLSSLSLSVLFYFIISCGRGICTNNIKLFCPMHPLNATRLFLLKNINDYYITFLE